MDQFFQYIHPSLSRSAILHLAADLWRSRADLQGTTLQRCAAPAPKGEALLVVAQGGRGGLPYLLAACQALHRTVWYRDD